MNNIIRFIKRLVVLIPGVLMTYIAVTEIYPPINRRIPTALAIFVTYVITAYLLIPAAMRLIRIIIKPSHIPLYCTTPDGFASDPLNVGVVGTRAQLTKAMKMAGWYLPDDRNLKTLAKMVAYTFLKKSYLTAPFSTLYLFGRSQDIGFELPVSESPSNRHHVRFWASTYTSDPRFRDHVFFWQRHSKSKAPDRILWIGAASLDTGLNIIRHNAQFTHRVHSDTNAERSLIIKGLKATGLVTKTRQITVGKPYKLLNRGLNASLSSDGKVVIAELKPRS